MTPRYARLGRQCCRRLTRGACLGSLFWFGCAPEVTIHGVGDAAVIQTPRAEDRGHAPALPDDDFYTRPDGDIPERPPPAGSTPVTFGGDGGSVVPAGAPSTTPMCRRAMNDDPRHELVDDLEDGDRNLLVSGERTGYWSASHDDTAGGIQVPDPFVVSEIVDCPDRRYAHLRGKGWRSWGAQLYLYLLREKAGYDLGSRYQGLSFWARSSMSTKVRVMFANRETDPAGNVCSSASGDTSAPACYNHFHREITLGSSWRRHAILWKDLAQGAFWGKALSTFDAMTVRTVIWSIDKNVAYDLWIDDVALIPR